MVDIQPIGRGTTQACDQTQGELWKRRMLAYTDLPYLEGVIWESMIGFARLEEHFCDFERGCGERHLR